MIAMNHGAEQTLHDEINLKRLVRRLEKTTSDPTWDESQGEHTWIKAQGTLQKIKYARKLLKIVDLYEEETPQRVQQLNELRIKLDRVEAFVKEIEQRATPTPKRPEPILPRIPQPLLPSSSSLTLDLPLSSQSALATHGAPGTASLLTDDLLLPADTPAYPTSTSFSFPTPMTLIPSTIPPSTSGITATAIATGAAPRFLQNSSALQQELSDQLAQMATQLKRNAIHFSDTLAKDHAVVEEAQQKLEGNFDVMHKERTRLRDHRGKSGGTTCLVLLIVLAVVLIFALMISIIRFT